jgi:glycosyltransferase involved in cell wall biosynthesis
MADNHEVLISICIPVYKRVDFLKRLLDSIRIQTFRNFEVVVTDDSPGTEIEEFSGQYRQFFPVRYFRNQISLGTPENWNEGIRQARGEWIKLMHDDDWFADTNSLNAYVTAIQQYPNTGLFFSAYENHFLDFNSTEKMRASPFRLWQLVKWPATLISRNVIGAPSVTIFKKDLGIYYDNRLKWLVDIDYYARVVPVTKVRYINKILVNIGLGHHQVTQDCFRQRPVEIPENFYVLNKWGIDKLKHILVYDAWWRLMRNLKIRNRKDIEDSGYHGPIHKVLTNMIGRQCKIPDSLINIGFVSKLFMFASYLQDRNKIY